MTGNDSAQSPIRDRPQPLDELTGSVTKLAIAWSEGDKESAEILFRDVWRFFRRPAGALAARISDRTPTEVINEGYIYIEKMHPKRFNDRNHFYATYIKAMKFWLLDHFRYLNAEMRNAPETDIKEHAIADDSRDFLLFVYDLSAALNRLVNATLITKEQRDYFFDNKILGVSCADLAEIHETRASRVRTAVKLVQPLISREMAAYDVKRQST